MEDFAKLGKIFEKWRRVEMGVFVVVEWIRKGFRSVYSRVVGCLVVGKR